MLTSGDLSLNPARITAYNVCYTKLLRAFAQTVDAGSNDLVLTAAIGAGSVTFSGAVSNLGSGTGASLTDTIV